MAREGLSIRKQERPRCHASARRAFEPKRMVGRKIRRVRPNPIRGIGGMDRGRCDRGGAKEFGRLGRGRKRLVGERRPVGAARTRTGKFSRRRNRCFGLQDARGRSLRRWVGENGEGVHDGVSLFAGQRKDMLSLTTRDGRPRRDSHGHEKRDKHSRKPRNRGSTQHGRHSVGTFLDLLLEGRKRIDSQRLASRAGAMQVKKSHFFNFLFWRHVRWGREPEVLLRLLRISYRAEASPRLPCD